ncbi:MAG: PBP1A family penicillin-binding protein [Caulobacteraceae bacterium]|nr:PBP1A family penicillin-binding protein [Caulobacteraceae bacterium]
MSDWILPPTGDGASSSPPPDGPPSKAAKPKKPNKPRPAKPPRKPLPIVAILLSLAATAVLLAVVLAVVVGVWTARVLLPSVPPLPDRSAMMVVNQSPGMTFQDRTGAVIAQRGAKHGTPVTVRSLPAYVPRAFLAAEDRRFYQHGPIDLHGIARAAWVNWRAHRTVQGGSTLTQQLAKTLFLTPDQTLKRKLQEAVIANRMEQSMTKDEVLELYLNRIFFGDNAYGIDAAAQTYFGKPASALTLPEAALLAALPKAPTRLALTNDMDAAMMRSRLILATMRAEGWISDTDAHAAMNVRPKLAPEAPGEGDYGYVLDMAAAQAVQIAGAQAPDLVVRLSIDPNLQAAGQAVVRKTLAEEGPRAGARQGALVLLAPDGGVRVLVGGTDHRLSAFNRATQAQRQPGSAFKPFVYATALEAGVKPGDIRQDAPVRFGPWAPTNYEGGYRGPVTVAQALAQSINTVAVRLTSEVGGARVAELAHRFGVKSIPDQPDLSVALGAYEVNLLELTSGYQVLQQGGQRQEPYLIEQISTARGDILFSHAGGAGVSVYDVAHAGSMVRMMEGVLTSGTGVRAAFGRPAAGKTGTTQNWRDAWFVGFTPDWVCGVWIGNDDDRPMNRVTGGQLPAQIWRQMMLTAHDGFPVSDFTWMPPPETGSPDVSGGFGVPAPEDDGGQPQEARTAQPGDDERPRDPRADFYGDLSNDFGHAAHEAPSREAPSRDGGGQDPEEARP